MKTAFAIVACSLLSLAVAQPHGRRHAAHQHQKDDVVVVYTTIVKTILGGGAPEPTFAPPKVEVAASVPTPAAPPAAPPVQKQKPSPTPPSGNAAGAGYGFSYSPYKADQICKTADDVKKDFAVIGDEYSTVRIYGTDCNQVSTVLAAAKEHNLKIFAGIYNIDDVAGAANTIVAAAKNDWDPFTHVSVGNELVNFAPEDQKAAKAAEVVAAIKTAKSILTAGGFKGKVSTVDTLVAARAYPQICEASDVCTVNCHPFFDGNVAAEGAGKFVTEQVATLAAVIPKDQKIIVTETGWPWQGSSNGPAVPSLENQAAALNSIKSAYKENKSEVILFTLFNDHWKVNTADQFGAEQFWGFKGLDAPSG